MNPEQHKLKLTAVFEPPAEGGFTCHFVELPEIFSKGETVDEAVMLFREISSHTMRNWNLKTRGLVRARFPGSFIPVVAASRICRIATPESAGRAGSAVSKSASPQESPAPSGLQFHGPLRPNRPPAATSRAR